MLSKQLFEFSLICHTLLIHTTPRFSKPLTAIFCAKFLLWQAGRVERGKTHEKAPDLTEKRMSGASVYGVFGFLFLKLDEAAGIELHKILAGIF